MKLLPGIFLLALGTAMATVAMIAFAIAPLSSLDGRAVLLITLLAGGAVFDALGVRDLVRVKRSASGMSPAS